jgi:hypothetical protein
MANRSLDDRLEQSLGLNPQDIITDTTTNGNIIDMQGYDSVIFYFSVGTVSDGTYTPLIQEGDESDLSDATAVSDADLTDTEANAALSESNTIKKIGYTGSKRYIRFNVVSASTSSGATGVNAIAVQGHPANSASITSNT